MCKAILLLLARMGPTCLEPFFESEFISDEAVDVAGQSNAVNGHVGVMAIEILRFETTCICFPSSFVIGFTSRI